MALERIKRMYK